MTISDRWSRRLWALLAVCGAAVPVARGLAGLGIFYVRDLQPVFLGTPSVAAAQNCLPDIFRCGIHPSARDSPPGLMRCASSFCPPAFLLRLIGSEVYGFNLWVAMPFPLAALGAWLFLAARFSPAPAATLGALAFAAFGAGDRHRQFSQHVVVGGRRAVGAVGGGSRGFIVHTAPCVAALAVAVAMQALAGEPVTMMATLVTAGMFVLIVNSASWPATRARVAGLASLAGGVALGLGLAAIQLVPLGRAAAQVRNGRHRPATTSGRSTRWR